MFEKLFAFALGKFSLSICMEKNYRDGQEYIGTKLKTHIAAAPRKFSL
jgi:hypothetical protein